MSGPLIIAILLTAAALAAIPWLLAMPHTGQHVVRPVTLPVTEQVIEVKQTADAPPWAIKTAANPVLNDDAETLALYERLTAGVS